MEDKDCSEFINQNINSPEREKYVENKQTKVNMVINLSYSREKKKFFLNGNELHLSKTLMLVLGTLIIKSNANYSSKNNWAIPVCRINKEANGIIGQNIINNDENQKLYYLANNIQVSISDKNSIRKLWAA